MGANPENLSLPPDLYARNTVISFLAGKICKRARPAILDVGGFNGRLSSFFDDYSKFVILDRKKKPEGETCEYKQADARKIPFSDRNFDVVVASDFIEHVKKEDRPKVIKEMLRVSKNYLIMGAPLKSRLVQTAEEQIKSQFFANAGQEHPFLLEHELEGLPDEDYLDALLGLERVKFMKVREGNLMNWYLQQLYTGTHYGETDNFDKYGFYTFYNQHLGELGNLRPPTYRTIYVIAREGDLPESEIYAQLQSKFDWNTETFMQLMRIAFDDLRFIIERKKEVLSSLENELAVKGTALSQKDNALSQKDAELAAAKAEKENIIAKAKKSIDAYREAVAELRNFLQEKEQALNFMKSILHEKDSRIIELEKEAKERTEVIQNLNVEIIYKRERQEKMRQQILKTEKSLQEARETLEGTRRELRDANEELERHGRSLREIFSSRAWKAVMVYSKIKTGLVLRPAKAVKKGWKILRVLGPRVFLERMSRKIGRGFAGAGHGAGAAAGAGAQGYDRYILENRLSARDIKNLRKKAAGFGWKPMVSILMPVYNVGETWLKKAIESVKNQVYGKWELCICDDASTKPHIKPMLENYARQDKRIKVIYRQKNGGIVKATNDAAGMAHGAYVALLDNDDELAPDALYEVVASLQEKKYDLIYTDEDKIGRDGRRCEPFFKPDWSPDLLLSCNYITHFSVLRRKIFNDIGGLREGFDGSQDFDLLLRFTEKTQEIHHIPRILYHWRKIKGSAAESVEAKPYAYEAAKKALYDAMKRRKIDGEITDGLWKGSYRLRRNITGEPLVSVIIPFKDKKDLLERCLKSILEKTTWQNYEILLVNNGSELLETAEYLERMARRPRSGGGGTIRILNFDGPFNYSAINNFAVGRAQGDFVLFLNNDTEVVSADWMQALLEQAQRKETGAVGAKLVFPDGKIQHAGVLMGLGGLAGHAFSRANDLDHGYCGLVDVIRNYSAVTAACMMVRREVFNEAGGFDEKNLAVAFNDVDFCLKLIEKGYLVVYTPYAVLQHRESVSRGYDVNLREVGFMQRKYAGLLKKGDPYYNPNLTLERPDFSLRCLDGVKRCVHDTSTGLKIDRVRFPRKR